MTPTEQKNLLDAIAAALHGWPDDGDRRTYVPEELPRLAARFRRKAEILNAIRDGVDVPDQPAVTEEGRRRWNAAPLADQPAATETAHPAPSALAREQARLLDAKAPCFECSRGRSFEYGPGHAVTCRMHRGRSEPEK